MATVEGSLRLFDGFSAPLNSILNALNLTISAFEDMQRLSASPVDTSVIDGMRDAAREAGAAYRQVQDEMARVRQNVATASSRGVPPVDIAVTPPVIPPVNAPVNRPEVPAVDSVVNPPVVPAVDIPVNPPEISTVEVPVTWRTDNLDIFTASGIDRFEQEIQSANAMLGQLNDTQSRITQQAEGASFLPADAITDIQALQSRMENLQTAVQQEISLDVGSDEASAQVEHLRAQLAQLMTCQTSLNNAMQGMDIEDINAAYLRLSQNVGSVERSVRDSFSRPVEVPPVEIPVTWDTRGLEVFTGVGTERFEQELQSVNGMMHTLEQTQQRIAAHAAEINPFPPEAAADFSSLQTRLQAIQSRIAQIAANPVNIGSERVSNELERLRVQLSQALTAQEALNSAAEGLDISAANAAYNRLSEAVSGTERYIRDNVDEQGRFNQAIQQGTENAGNLMNTIKGAIAAYATVQTLGNAISLSDTMTQTSARLALIVDDGGSVEELQNKIYASAQNARGNYLSTADAISKLGTQASQAFRSNDELIAFTELLNKQFVNAGTSAQGIDSVMLQLTQSMASGKLQGEELNSVLDNAAPIVQDIQRYLENVQGVDASNIKELASEGKITADIIKNAMFYAADDINAKFESIPMTFEQIWQSFQNNALMAFQPVLNRINDIANNEAFKAFVSNAENALWMLSAVILQIFDAVGALGSAVYNNWSWLSPLIYGVIAAMTAYITVLGTYNTIQAVSNGLKAAAAFQETVHAAALAMSSGQTFLATAAQYGLNAALLACPITWIVIGIMALVAVFYAAIAAVNHFAGTSVSATGIIAGAIAVAGAAIANIVIAVFNFIVQRGITVWNFLAAFANFFATFLNDPAAAIANLIADLVDSCLAMLQSLASAIDTIFGSSLSGAVQGWRDSLSGWVDSTFGKGEEVMAKLRFDDFKLDRIEYGKAWDVGYNFGEGIEDKVSGLFKFEMPEYGSDALGNQLDGIYGNTGDTAANTAAAADALDYTEEDLAYLKDIAEREAINRYTTAEITVNQENTNYVDRDTDLDGVMDFWANSFAEKLEISGEGVHP